MVGFRKNAVACRTSEAFLYSLNALRPEVSDQPKCLIFGQGRTGSTLLEALVSSTGYFERFGEILSTDYANTEILFPAQFVQGLAKWHNDSGFVFHTKIYQLTSFSRRRPVEPTAFLKELSRQGFRIVYLRRENIVKHALSTVLVQHRGQFFKRDDRVEELAVSVDCSTFTRMVAERIEYGEAERDALSGVERDLESAHNHQSTVDGLLEQFGLESRPVRTKLRKINVLPTAELVLNYDEFSECIRNNGWDAFLT